MFFLLFIFVYNSMMLLDGHQKNTIQMTNNPLEDRDKVVGRLQSKKKGWLRNLVLCGMTHLVIIMMLLLASTTMEIQVLFSSCCIVCHVNSEIIVSEIISGYYYSSSPYCSRMNDAWKCSLLDYFIL